MTGSRRPSCGTWWTRPATSCHRRVLGHLGGPCKQLTPTLEKIVRSARRPLKLVKIDIDANRSLVQQLAQLGLPVQWWRCAVASLLQPWPADRRPLSGCVAGIRNPALRGADCESSPAAICGADLLAEAKAALEAGDAEHATELFGVLLHDEPRTPMPGPA